MTETFSKVDSYTMQITVPAEPVVIEKTLDELEAELAQAKESLVYVKQRHADEIAPIQKTIDLFQLRYDECVKAGCASLKAELAVADAGIEEVIK